MLNPASVGKRSHTTQGSRPSWCSSIGYSSAKQPTSRSRLDYKPRLIKFVHFETYLIKRRGITPKATLPRKAGDNHVDTDGVQKLCALTLKGAMLPRCPAHTRRSDEARGAFRYPPVPMPSTAWRPSSASADRKLCGSVDFPVGQGLDCWNHSYWPFVVLAGLIAAVSRMREIPHHPQRKTRHLAGLLLSRKSSDAAM